jgi:hypothetical protein
VVSFAPRPLYLQGKSPWYPLDRKLGGPQNRSGRGGEEKNSQFLSELEPPDHPAPGVYGNMCVNVQEAWVSDNSVSCGKL